MTVSAEPGKPAVRRILTFGWRRGAAAPSDTDPACVLIDYTNHRGDRDIRRIVPQRLWFGEAEWHPGKQWILDAWDMDRGAIRSFAMTGVHSWRPTPG